MAKKKKRAVPSAATAPEPGTAGNNPEESSIAALAYGLWLARGCPRGSDQEDWFRAERILKGLEKAE